MLSKIVWIAMWVTLTLWMGGLWGCAAPGDDQNYKELEDDSAPFIDVERPGLQSREEIARELGISLAEDEERPMAVEPSPAVADIPTAEAAPIEAEPLSAAHMETEPTEPIEPVEPYDAAWTNTIVPDEDVRAESAHLPALEVAERVPAEPVSDTEPSLLNLDRSNWGRVTYTPAEGTTRHTPIYFRDRNLRAEQEWTAGSEHAEGTELIDEKALAQAFAGAEAGGWTDATNVRDLVTQPVKFGLDLVFLPRSLVREKPHKLVSSPSAASPATVETASESAAPTPAEAVEMAPVSAEAAGEPAELPEAPVAPETPARPDETPGELREVPADPEAPAEPDAGAGMD